MSECKENVLGCERKCCSLWHCWRTRFSLFQRISKKVWSHMSWVLGFPLLVHPFLCVLLAFFHKCRKPYARGARSRIVGALFLHFLRRFSTKVCNRLPCLHSHLLAPSKYQGRQIIVRGCNVVVCNVNKDPHTKASERAGNGLGTLKDHQRILAVSQFPWS